MAGQTIEVFEKRHGLDLPNKANDIHTTVFQDPNWDLIIYIFWIYPLRIPVAKKDLGWDSRP